MSPYPVCNESSVSLKECPFVGVEFTFYLLQLRYHGMVHIFMYNIVHLPFNTGHLRSWILCFSRVTHSERDSYYLYITEATNSYLNTPARSIHDTPYLYFYTFASVNARAVQYVSLRNLKAQCCAY